MHELVQSAMEAARQGDRTKALELVKQVINSNPNDIDALLTLATIVDESKRKRQILNRVLTLDAANKTAREMTLEMDRAEINSYLSRPTGTSASKLQSQPDASSSSQSHLPQEPSNIPLDKPMSFQYSAAWMVILYVFTTLSCCGTFWFAAINMSDGFIFLAMALVLGLTALTISSKVEVDENVIRMSSRFRTIEMNWNEIAGIKFDSLKGNLELRTNIGESATISTYIKGYKTIIALLRQKRPDLFTEEIFQPKQPVQSPDKPAPVSKPAPQPEKPYYSSGTYSFEPVPDDQEQVLSAPPIVKPHNAPQPKPSSKARAEKPLVFKFPLFWRILMVLSLAFFGCSGLLVATQNVINSLPFLGFALIIGLVFMAFSPKVEITETGIRGSGMLSSSEAGWNEIVSIKSNVWKRRLELSKNDGEVVNVSTQVGNYPRIVEIIRQKRPDLFGGAARSGMSGSQGGTATPAFASTKTFKRGFFAQYGIFLLMSPLCLFGVWVLFASEDKFVGLGVGIIGLFFMGMSLFSINQVKLDPNKLTTETLFGEKEYTAREIREISMKTVRSRQGIANNFIHIRPVKGSAISLAGFPEGDEIIYGILVNWWETYKSR